MGKVTVEARRNIPEYMKGSMRDYIDCGLKTELINHSNMPGEWEQDLSRPVRKCDEKWDAKVGCSEADGIKKIKKYIYYTEATAIGFRAAMHSWTQVWLNRDQ